MKGQNTIKFIMINFPKEGADQSSSVFTPSKSNETTGYDIVQDVADDTKDLIVKKGIFDKAFEIPGVAELTAALTAAGITTTVLAIEAAKYPALAEAGRTGITNSMAQWALSLPFAFPNVTTGLAVAGAVIAVIAGKKGLLDKYMESKNK